MGVGNGVYGLGFRECRVSGLRLRECRVSGLPRWRERHACTDESLDYGRVPAAGRQVQRRAAHLHATPLSPSSMRHFCYSMACDTSVTI